MLRAGTQGKDLSLLTVQRRSDGWKTSAGVLRPAGGAVGSHPAAEWRQTGRNLFCPSRLTVSSPKMAALSSSFAPLVLLFLTVTVETRPSPTRDEAQVCGENAHLLDHPHPHLPLSCHRLLHLLGSHPLPQADGVLWKASSSPLRTSTDPMKD